MHEEQCQEEKAHNSPVSGTSCGKRTISREAGMALEKLGHAIEYMEDMYIRVYGPFPPCDGDAEAVLRLKALNREIYKECPPRDGLWSRLSRWLRRHP